MNVNICCSPISQAPLGRDEAQRLAHLLKVLADPARLSLLSLIQASPDGEACVCDLMAPIELSQPTVSHHLKVLHDAGLVDKERRGTWMFYRVNPGAIDSIRNALA